MLRKLYLWWSLTKAKSLGSRAALLARTGHAETQATLREESAQDKSAKPTRKGGITAKFDSEVATEIADRLDQILGTLEVQRVKIETLTEEFKDKAKNVSAQMDALMRIQTYLNSGVILPSFCGWPVSPDFACLLIEKIEQNHYDAVIEFGSGTSTVLIANVLDRLRSDSHETYQIAFEHLEKYYAKTWNSLTACRTKRHQANLVLAPLINMLDDEQNGAGYKFFDCRAQLTNLAQKDQLSSGKLLVIVDGPPGVTGRHARFPSLPVTLAAFPHARIDFVLDDTKRRDEQEILILWEEILRQTGRPYQIIEYDCAKGATFLEVQAC